MAKMTVADLLAETLAGAGVKRIWGVTGDSLNGFNDSLRRLGKIEWMHVRHEEVAAFAAGAEAAVTGNLAVCAGSCGPGNLHLINGLSTATGAMRRCSPSRRKFLVRNRPRLFPGNPSARTVQRMQPLCRADIGPRANAIGAASRDARGDRQQGVAVVVIPGDRGACRSATGSIALGLSCRSRASCRTTPTSTVWPRCSISSPAVTLLCGSGCAGAHDEVVSLADACSARPSCMLCAARNMWSGTIRSTSE